MLDSLGKLLQEASFALQTNDLSTLARLCDQAEAMQATELAAELPGKSLPLDLREADSLTTALAGFGRQVHLAARNIRLRQALLRNRIERQHTWVP